MLVMCNQSESAVGGTLSEITARGGCVRALNACIHTYKYFNLVDDFMKIEDFVVVFIFFWGDVCKCWM